jgi:ribosomal protein L9
VLSKAAEAAAAERGAKEAASKAPEKIGIFGSVSTSDIAANLKAVLAENDAGRQIAISAENISFVEETEEKDRMKHLGSFDIRIRLDSARESIRRTVNVKAQE